MSILRSILLVIVLVTLANAVPLLKNVDTPDNSEFSQFSVFKVLPEDSKIDYFLPENVKPKNYAIKLTPNIGPNNFTFIGESVIDIIIVNPTKTITLHAKNLTISGTKLVNSKNASKVFTLKSQKHDDLKDFEIFEFDKDIPVGDYRLSLSFVGKLHDDMYGFYRSWYKNERGETVWLATTQFEPTHARRAFPCFDEPALKATFEISISHFDNYTVRSNTNMSSISPDPNHPAKIITKFKVTPVMSTYLVAFIVSDFKSLTSENGTFRVWSKSGTIHTGNFAHEIGQKELKALEEYTGIEETMHKMDNFAIPQFRAGAMENWGIVTYRESALLFEENVTTTSAKQSIATVMSHEFAHQWFGNLVSPVWWNVTWLNEGFANYFEYYITDKVQPTWRLMEQFVIRNLQDTAFVADAKNTSHAMNAKVASPKEIASIFDSITYSKAGSVIRMFSHASTEDNFKKGLRNYLIKMKHKAANPDHLFDELAGAVSGFSDALTLRKALDLWANQPGYPVLNVTVDDKKHILYVSQERFLSKKPDAATKPKEKWLIPINYVTEKGLNFNDTKPSNWLKAEDVTTTITGVDMKENQWVILNKKQTGYYRVNYDKTNWKRIGAYLYTKEYEKIDPINRAQILDDSFSLAHAGYIDYEIFLNISKYLQREVDYVPWHAAFRAFNVLKKALTNTPKYNLFTLYMLRLTENLEKSVNYTETEKDDHITKFNRNNAVSWACHMGSKTCRAAAHKNLVDHLTGAQKISADLRSVMLCAGLRSANASIWEKTFNLYATSKNEAERTLILNALGCTTDTTILQSYLAKIILLKSNVTLQTALLAVCVGSPAGINVAFDFVNDNYKDIVGIDNKTDTVVTCMNEIASRMTTQVQVFKLIKFINVTANTTVGSALKAKGLVNAKSNVEWFKTYGKGIETFFDGQKLVSVSQAKEPNSSPRISLPTLSFTILLVLLARYASLIR